MWKGNKAFPQPNTCVQRSRRLFPVNQSPLSATGASPSSPTAPMTSYARSLIQPPSSRVFAGSSKRTSPFLWDRFDCQQKKESFFLISRLFFSTCTCGSNADVLQTKYSSLLSSKFEFHAEWL